MNYKIAIIFLLLSVVIAGCSDDNGGNPKTDLDKSALLINYADNLIIPAYDTLYNNIIELENRYKLLEANYSEENLNKLRVAQTNLALRWQNCSQFEFGPAEDVALRQSVNTFPTDTIKIEENISTGDYSLVIASSFKAKGIPALDYLLYGVELGEEESVFTSPKRLSYIKAIISDLKQNIEYVHNSWIEYRSEFISKTGNDVGSSLSLMINQFVFDFELAKRAKIGFPLGIYSNDVLPFNFEAPYSYSSSSLLFKNLQSYRTFILGIGDSDNSKTDNIKEYLDELSATRGEELLSDAILNEFDSIINELNSLDVPLRKGIMIDTEKQKINSLYETMQKSVVLLKNDMTSEMGIKISFQDNDGD